MSKDSLNLGELVTTGKAKSLYRLAGEPGFMAMEFRDDTSAFDGAKKAALAGKGEVNNKVNAKVMTYLAGRGIRTHFVSLLANRWSKVEALDMLPIECVVRNRASGSICRRLGIEKGRVFSQPLLEFFLKDDELHDPLISEDHIRAFAWANSDQVAAMRKLSLKINGLLVAFFAKGAMDLVDFKLEFGVASASDGAVCLGDEFTPDGCRLWDKSTGKTLDKDRFREDKGEVVESYLEVARRIGVEDMAAGQNSA